MLMIEHVRTVGFKGSDINEDIPQKVIYHGNNKSGKSSRAEAIALALFGHIPFSTAGKKPGDILDSFGNESLIVAVTINGKEFGRKFSRNPKGGVSQSLQIDGKRAAADNFAIMLNRSGAPKIADTAEFMKQSEAKKIDTLFELFPNDTLANIDTEIEEAKEDVSKWQKKKTGAESTIQRLTDSKTNIQLPSGSVAEVQADIKKHETEIIDLEKQIKEAEINQVKIESKEEGKKEEKKDAEQRTLEKMESLKQQPEQGASNSIPESVTKSISHFEALLTGSEKQPNAENKNQQMNQSSMANQTYMRESILRIIGALNSTGCTTCAALIVAKQELKKYRGQQ